MKIQGPCPSGEAGDPPCLGIAVKCARNLHVGKVLGDPLGAARDAQPEQPPGFAHRHARAAQHELRRNLAGRRDLARELAAQACDDLRLGRADPHGPPGIVALEGLARLRRRQNDKRAAPPAMHESLCERLVVRYHLAGFERDEVGTYVYHRLRLAGCELPLFEAPAIKALFQSARGLPRQINRTARYALSAAALDNAKTVNAEHLQNALDELLP